MSRENFTRFFGFLLLGCAAFGAGLANPWVFDDVVFLARNDWLRLEFIPGFFRSFLPISTHGFAGFRPLVLASFALESDLSGGRAWILRGGNLGFHCANAALVFALARRFWTRYGWHDAKRWALFAALVFLLHPLQTNVIYLAWKRSDAYALFGLLAGLLAFGRWLEDPRAGRRWLALGLCGQLFALLSKESAAIFPVALGLAHACVFVPVRPRREWTRMYVAVALLAAAHLYVTLVVQPAIIADTGMRFASYMPASIQLGRWQYLGTQVVGVFRYLGLVLLPNNLQIFHWIDPVRAATDPRFVAAALALGGLALFVLATARRRPWLAFLVAWFFLALAPTSSLIPLQMILDEDRLYVPLIAVGIGFALVFYRLERLFPDSRRIFRAFLVFLIAIYVALDVLRAATWSEPTRLWAQNTLAYPQDPRPWLNLGTAYAQKGETAKARFCFEESLRLDPDYGTAHYFLGEFLLVEGDDASARPRFERAIALGYLPADATMSLAMLDDRAGKVDAAERGFRESLRLHPANPLALRNYATFTWARRRDYPAAMELLARAHAVAPWEAEIAWQTARITWENGDTAGALAVLDELRRDHPRFTAADELRREIFRPLQ